VVGVGVGVGGFVVWVVGFVSWVCSFLLGLCGLWGGLGCGDFLGGCVIFGGELVGGFGGWSCGLGGWFSGGGGGWGVGIFGGGLGRWKQKLGVVGWVGGEVRMFTGRREWGGVWGLYFGGEVCWVGVCFLVGLLVRVFFGLCGVGGGGR